MVQMGTASKQARKHVTAPCIPWQGNLPLVYDARLISGCQSVAEPNQVDRIAAARDGTVTVASAMVDRTMLSRTLRLFNVSC